jgi:RNA recognition motif. (a.k.a. RRM, RBD, or RNP domain)
MSIIHQYKVFVGSIPVGATDSEVQAHFRLLAPEARFCFERKPHKNVSSGGYGFLILSSRRELEAIVATSHYIGGRLLKCGEYFSGDTLNDYRVNLSKRRILIRNVKKTITDKDVEEFFGKFGELDSAYIVKFQSSNRQRSFGYVTFKRDEPANALLALGKVIINGVEIFILPFLKSSPGNLPNSNQTFSKMAIKPENVSKKSQTALSKTTAQASPKLSGELHYNMLGNSTSLVVNSSPEFPRYANCIPEASQSQLVWKYGVHQYVGGQSMNDIAKQKERPLTSKGSLLRVSQCVDSNSFSQVYGNYSLNEDSIRKQGKPTSIQYRRYEIVALNHIEPNLVFRLNNVEVQSSFGQATVGDRIQEATFQADHDHDSLAIGLEDC